MIEFLFMRSLLIDARMLCNSGIGIYLQNILKRIPVDIPFNVSILVRKEDLSFLKQVVFFEADFIVFDLSLYGLAQHVFFSRLKNFDILWVPHYNVPLFFEGTIISTIHDIAHVDLRQVFGFSKFLYANLYLCYAVQRCEHIITVSGFTKMRLSDRFGGRRISTIKNGVDPDWRLRRVKEKRFENTYAFIGNVKPHKNLRSLIMAMEKAETAKRLIVVGRREGFLTNDNLLLEFINESSVDVEFTGFISDEALKVLLSSVDALVFPSLYEGFGLPVLEAMAIGTPVLTSNTSSLSEVGGLDFRESYSDGTCIYFNPESVLSIVESLNYFEKLTFPEIDKMTKNGKKRALNFDWGKSARNILTVLNKVS